MARYLAASKSGATAGRTTRGRDIPGSKETAVQAIVGSIVWAIAGSKNEESGDERTRLRASNFMPPNFLFLFLTLRRGQDVLLIVNLFGK